MNFESIKNGFISYLQEKLGAENPEYSYENIPDSNISIFMYSNEFKQYLTEEVGADVSIFSKSINDIMNMEVVNGKLVDTNTDSFERNNNSSDSDMMADFLNEMFSDEKVINTLDVDMNGSLNKDEMNTFLMGVANADENQQVTFDNMAKSVQAIQNGTYSQEEIAESNGNILNRMLDGIYENNTVRKTLDLDGDGELSDEEKAQFEEYIKGYDGNSDELTEADIKRAFDDIMSGKFSYDNDLKTRSEEIDKLAEIEAAGNEPNSEIGGSDISSPESSGYSGGYGNAGSYNSFSSSNSNAPKTLDNMTLEELEAEKNSRESEVSDARQAVNDVHSGQNEAVKKAEEDEMQAEDDYKNAVANDEKIDAQTKKNLNECLEKISKQEDVVDGLNSDISDKENEIKDQNYVISEDKSNISALESALASLQQQSSEDPEKQAEIDAKIAKVRQELEDAKAKLEKDNADLETLEKAKGDLEKQLTDEQAVLDEYEKEKDEIEKEISANCSDETKEAMKAYNDAKSNTKQTKETELSNADSALKTALEALDEVNEKINEKKAEKTKKENSISEYNFDFELNLSGVQERELEAFKQNWEQNHDKYEKVEEATGMPAELVAAIHWREGSGNFNTYLHNGQPLGQTTTIVPKGIYFEDWTEAAIDAVTNYGGGLSSIEEGNLDTYYDYAEKYNGLGYRKRGLPSPYVWAGTNNYSSGKYVRDGVFDPNAVDQQLGVAVMLQALLG